MNFKALQNSENVPQSFCVMFTLCERVGKGEIFWTNFSTELEMAHFADALMAEGGN